MSMNQMKTRKTLPEICIFNLIMIDQVFKNSFIEMKTKIKDKGKNEKVKALLLLLLLL